MITSNRNKEKKIPMNRELTFLFMITPNGEANKTPIATGKLNSRLRKLALPSSTEIK